jgi:tRNA A37 threonylcarbamoyladenosine synthetase subunit TsaC/SUA5/YrdC
MNYSRVFSINYDNLNLVGKQFISGNEEVPNIVISPTEAIYYIICNPFDHISYKNFKEYANIHKKKEFIVYNLDVARPLIVMNEIEERIIKSLSNHLWNKNKYPDTIKFRIKASSNVNPELLDKDGNITIVYYNHTTIHALHSYSMAPLLAQVLYINDIPCTHFEQVINYYSNNNVTIFKQDEPCTRGCIPTELLIKDNTILIENRGTITISNLQNILSKDGIENIMINIDKKIIDMSINKPLIIPPINKKIILFKWANLNIDTEKEILEGLKIMTENYLSSVLFVDFGGKNSNLVKLFGGYVDLSEEGNYYEGISNLYNIIHQSTIYDHLRVILIYDGYSYHKHDMVSNLHEVLLDMILEYAGNNSMIIPIDYISDEYRDIYKNWNEECMECID